MRPALLASSVLFLSCAGSPPQPPPVKQARPATLAPPPAAPSVEETVRALQEAALASSNAHAIVKSLTSEVGARITGGPRDRAAVEWALRAMKDSGLSNVRAVPVKVPHWERGAEDAEILAPSAQKLRVLALGGSSGTPEGGIVAEVVEVDSLAALDKLDDKVVKGKIVFFNVATRRAKDGAGYGESVGTRFNGPKRAGEKGALAAVLRSIGTDSAAPHTGATSRQATIPGAGGGGARRSPARAPTSFTSSSWPRSARG